ncbi:MAG: signal recognition particle-docking protein FtsY [Gammaproteobacteria bacterium]|nr:signal recognition particle-docking protein FtsY [Gammaproteobacteria bacterium]
MFSFLRRKKKKTQEASQASENNLSQAAETGAPPEPSTPTEVNLPTPEAVLTSEPITEEAAGSKAEPELEAKPEPEQASKLAAEAPSSATSSSLPETDKPAEPEVVLPEIPIETPPKIQEKSADSTLTEESELSPPKESFFTRLKKGLSKTRRSFTDSLASLVLGRKEIDEDLLEELEMILLTADVGIDATDRIIQNLTDQVSRKELKDPEMLITALKQQLQNILDPINTALEVDAHLAKKQGPFVILMVGINGVGKTTTIGKLAKKYQNEGKSVMLAAGDTFRAAAVEQLQTWGERNKVPVIAQKTGADSAAVLFDAIQSAKAKNIDVLIADTAGRLHTQTNLMEELKKVVRVMKKVDGEAPHEVMLVIDAGTGQNALNQAEQFKQAVGVSGITLTKLDGTAKGGIVFALAEKSQIPIRFIGVGESIDDLRPFDPVAFTDALFDQQN